MQAIIFIGIQATGKSTFFKEKFFNTHMRINLDLLKTRPNPLTEGFDKLYYVKIESPGKFTVTDWVEY